jgi:Ca2+/Na+ antiporter
MFKKEHEVYWLFGLFVAMTVVALILPKIRLSLYVVAWLINLILMLVIVCVISKNKEKDPKWDWQGGWFAILVDGRNKYSLSRFQILLWTIIVISAFWTIAVARAADSITADHAGDYICEAPESTEEEASCASPAAIQLPEILWALMGISVTSAVASPLIKGNKEERTKKNTDYYKLKLKPADDGVEVRNSMGEELADADGNPVNIVSDFDTVGAVSRRVKGPPMLSDMFMSEDPESEFVLDIGKVQNFFFVMVAVIVYAVALGAAIAGTESIAALYQFPDFSEGLVAILGISTAGYLVDKAADTGPDPTP